MPVFDSTAVTQAEYDPATAVLSLWFAESGGPYDYHLVPKRIYDDLCRARSKGKFFNQHIRDGFSSKRR